MAPLAQRQLKSDFVEPAQKASAEIIAFPEVISDNEKKRREQFIEQNRMLQEALATNPDLQTSTEQWNQTAYPYTEDHKEQAAAQENHGSIFSSAFLYIPR